VLGRPDDARPQKHPPKSGGGRGKDREGETGVTQHTPDRATCAWCLGCEERDVTCRALVVRLEAYTPAAGSKESGQGWASLGSDAVVGAQWGGPPRGEARRRPQWSRPPPQTSWGCRSGQSSSSTPGHWRSHRVHGAECSRAAVQVVRSANRSGPTGRRRGRGRRLASQHRDAGGQPPPRSASAGRRVRAAAGRSTGCSTAPGCCRQTGVGSTAWCTQSSGEHGGVDVGASGGRCRAGGGRRLGTDKGGRTAGGSAGGGWPA
jgi:hypothetical protein